MILLLRKEFEILGIKALYGIALPIFSEEIGSNRNTRLQLLQGFHLQIVHMPISQRFKIYLTFSHEVLAAPYVF